ncbi:hypothetical protein [Caudovirales GX15bay]|nr:hypothetical protein [Caudovirales GX15bay]
MTLTVLFCGSRDWIERLPIEITMAGLVEIYGPQELLIVHGAARGADTLAGEAARRRDLPIASFPADWNVHDREGRTAVQCHCPAEASRCRAAGPRRNQLMLEATKPGLILGFTDDLSQSKGTRDMITRADNAGILWWVCGRSGMVLSMPTLVLPFREPERDR